MEEVDYYIYLFICISEDIFSLKYSIGHDLLYLFKDVVDHTSKAILLVTIW